VSFNRVAGRALLSLFQQSDKSFKGKFLKIRCNKRVPTQLDGFPLYWTEKPRFEGVRCLEEMPPTRASGVPLLLQLEGFDTTTLISQEFSSVGLKAYIGISSSFTLVGADWYICLLNFPYFSCRQHVGYA